MRHVGIVAAIALGLSVTAHAEEPRTHEGEKHWSYTTGITPAHWGEVAPTCATGKEQSPIALSTHGTKAQVPPLPLEISWSRSTGELVDTGHSEQVNLPPGNTLTYGGTTYALLQFHFHTPSEHTLDGRAAPMEVHFVHRSPEGKLAVLGVLLTEGKEASAFAPVLTGLPAAGEKRSVEVDLPAMLPVSRAHFVYEGSLTTPPCSEGVQWLVLRTGRPISRAEIDAFRQKYPRNARPVQPPKGRAVATAP